MASQVSTRSTPALTTTMSRRPVFAGYGRCTETGIMTGAPYRCVEPTHWVFEGTGLAAGEVFGKNNQHMRCPGGASGHETDKMSPNSPAGTVLLARGTIDGAPTEPGQETGGAEMVTCKQTHGSPTPFETVFLPSNCLKVDYEKDRTSLCYYLVVGPTYY